MSGFSTQLAQNVANHFFKNISTPGSSAHYLALFTADPTDVNSVALTKEVVGTWYARQIVTFDAPAAADPVTIANSAQLLFDPVTSATTVTHWGVMNSLTTGVLLSSEAFSVSKSLNVDDVFVVNAGDLVLSFS